MLKQRVITALVLMAIVLPCIFAPVRWPFMLLVSVVLSLAAWEWARLQGFEHAHAWAAGAGFAALTLLAAQLGWHRQTYPDAFWTAVTLAWLAAAILVLRLGVAGWARLPRLWRLAAGLWILATTWLAVLAAYALGINFLLSALALVWAADIGAYFAGRALGQKIFSRRLAPAISPGKSWEGVWGGLLTVLALAFLWIAADRQGAAQWGPSLYSILRGHGLWTLLLGCAFLCALSVMGDLQESLVKRSAGIKDSSHILPGHGGMLDRIDGLLPTVAAAIMLVALASP